MEIWINSMKKLYILFCLWYTVLENQFRGNRMYRTRLCLGTNIGYGVSTEEQIRMFRKVGFEAFFTPWDEDLKRYRAVADEVGMIYQSIHAPFIDMTALWRTCEETEKNIGILLTCVDDCAELGVPILVVHPWGGADVDGCPNDAGIANFRRIVAYAKQKNVRIALENTEGEPFLVTLMDAFREETNVGFCWDSGHELCYNRGRDMLALYGDRLIATHINDNTGVSDFEGRTHWRDDLHLMPFDGACDWRRAAARLAACGYDGILTLEVNKQNAPGRFEGRHYKTMPLEIYLTELYVRACRLAHMIQYERNSMT